MIPATQVFSRDFDAAFYRLAPDLQNRIESRIDLLGMTLATCPHKRLQGVNAFRLRIGDYRVIYDFNLTMGRLYLLDVAHRREVYRDL